MVTGESLECGLLGVSQAPPYIIIPSAIGYDKE